MKRTTITLLALLVAAPAAAQIVVEWTKDEERAVTLAEQAVRPLQTPYWRRCSFIGLPTAEGDEIIVDVREIHDVKKGCRGAADLSPIMFRVSVNLKSGKLMWDRGSFDEYRPMPRRRMR